MTDSSPAGSAVHIRREEKGGAAQLVRKWDTTAVGVKLATVSATISNFIQHSMH
jgi:hypothetical protein